MGLGIPFKLTRGGGTVEIKPDGSIEATPGAGDFQVKGDFDVTGTITGTLNLTQLQLEDDEQLQFGDAPDYWWEYESANTRLRLRSTDVDGGGSDGDVLRVNDGSRQIIVLEGLRLNSGQLLLPDGSASAPAYSFSSDETGGMYFLSNRPAIADNGEGVVEFLVSGGPIVATPSDGRFAWTSGAIGTARDLELHRDAPDTLALRRSNNNNVLRIYNEFTDASNYARLAFVTADGAYTISPQAAGTGTLRGLTIGGTGTSLGFFGATPVAQQSALTAKDTSTVDGTYGADEEKVIKNNRTRIEEIETRLSAYGLLP